MHGGDIYRQQVTYDFSVNINPIGLPDAVRQVMENSGDLAMQYPDLQCQKLRIKLADCLGIRPEQTMGFGDGENDITRLRMAGIGVAMGNACDTAKKAADYVTLTNDEDGVAAAIEKLIFKRLP